MEISPGARENYRARNEYRGECEPHQRRKTLRLFCYLRFFFIALRERWKGGESIEHTFVIYNSFSFLPARISPLLHLATFFSSPTLQADNVYPALTDGENINNNNNDDIRNNIDEDSIAVARGTTIQNFYAGQSIFITGKIFFSSR